MCYTLYCSHSSTPHFEKGFPMDKTVLITGASSGFGLSCAKLFAEKGAKLILTARRLERLQSIQKELEKKTEVHIFRIDVRDRINVDKAVEKLPESFRDIDILINNAGLALGFSPAYEADLDDWDQMVDTNIKGLCYFTRAILPSMVKRKKGHIVNIGSVAGSWPYPGGNTYGATKAFVKQFSRNLRADLRGTNIRVTNIEPGLAETEFSLVRFYGAKDVADSVYKGASPLTPEDIAESVFWATSQPEHVNINRIELMPTCQTFDHLTIDRKE